MSFVDYGLNVFGWRRNRLQSCGDCTPEVSSNKDENSCYHVIINHLIDLGTHTETELAAVRRELEKYRRIRLTAEQIHQLKKLDAEFRKQEIDRFVRNSELENGVFITEYPSDCYDTSDNKEILSPTKETSGNELCSACHKPITPRRTEIDDKSTPRRDRQPLLSEAAFRETIIQKDSEIISLKNEKAVKETEVKELEEQNRKLEMIMEKMKDDIELLESSSRISQSQIEDVVQKKNKELETLRENVEKLERDLEDERQDRALIEREMTTLQTLVREAQALRKNLSEELKVSKRRIESLESSNASLAATIKQLQQERDNLDKQNCEQENEIEKLLNIIKRLNEKYDKSKDDLSSLRQDLEDRERKLSQCREQLETMEREVGKLISDLADCLGHEADDNHEMTKLKEDQRQNMYAQARELTQGLNRIVREHEKCHAHRLNLMKQIHRLGAMNRARGLARPIGSIEDIKSNASQEIARLKRVVLGADNYQAIKTDLKGIIDELLLRIDSRRIESSERAYLKVASEASLALEKLDKKINDHEVYRKCENFLLLELQNLQHALDGAEKTINGLEVCPLNINDDDDMKASFEDNGNYAIVESVLSKKILEQVHNSTQIVIRFTTALRDESSSKLAYNKKLETQLQQALLELNELGVEKCQLQNDYNESLKKSQELADEVDKLKDILTEKSKELQTLNETMQSRFESFQQENEKLRTQASIYEKKYHDSRAENTALINTSDEIIDSLQRELQTKDLKLQEYGKFNDYLNTKLEDSNKIIGQLQNTIVQENMRKVDLDSFTILHDRILELAHEKDELIEKISTLELQLASFERNNARVQASLTKILDDNEFLEKCIKDFKKENERLGKSIELPDRERLDLKCDELLEKIESIAKCSKQAQKSGTGMTSRVEDSVVRALEKEITCLKDKLLYQQKEIMAKEKEMHEKSKKIEQLNNQINKIKDDSSLDSPAVLLKRIETLNREKSDLKNELKQTLMKYEDKLAEMHKQYKHNEIELHKSHNDSIRRLEAKYMEMMKEEGKIFSSQAWLRSLNQRELQELHDKICRTPLCPNSTYEKDLYEEQKRRNFQKNNPTNYGVKKPLQSKKDVRGVKNPIPSTSKPSSRQRLSARESLSNHSIIIPEKEYPHGIGNVRSDPANRNK